MRKKGRKLLLILLATGVFLGGCKSYPSEDGKTEDEPEQIYQIGLSFDSFVIERWLRDRDAFVSTANQLGAEVNVQNANGSLEEQKTQIEYFIQKKMDLIVVIAVDCEGLTAKIEKAKKAGIKVISYDRLIKNVDTDLYITFDNEKVGEEMAQAMIEALPAGGDIACISGPESDNNVFQIREGFMNTIKESGLTISYTANCENWDADEAPEYTEEALKNVPDLVGIMCGNDDIALQVFQTLSEYRLAGKVILVGQDADLSACQRIVAGTQTMTVFKEVEEMASIAATLAVELIKGSDITDPDSVEYSVDQTMYNGKSNIPYYKLEPVVVTKENLDRIIIDSGFHNKNEVYLNRNGEESVEN